MAFPEINVNALVYSGKGPQNVPFRRNFYDIPFKYRIRTYKFLYLLTKGIPKKHDQRYLNNFLSVAENLSLYYTISNNQGLRNFYMNIKGRVGLEPVAKYLDSINKKYLISKDPESPIWISRLERFVESRFLNGQTTLFDEIITVLNAPEVDHLQLSCKDLDLLIGYFENIYDTNYGMSAGEEEAM